MTQRTHSSPRGTTARGSGAARGGAGQPEKLSRLGETDETQVDPPEGGDLTRAESIPVGGLDELDIPARTSRSFGGRRRPRLSDITDVDEDDEDEDDKGIGPYIVILHDGVTGRGTRALGPLRRGKVVRLSALLGDKLVREGSKGELRRALHHYTKGENPAIREATDEEAQYDEVSFLEGEEQLSAALDTTQQTLADQKAENDRLREIVKGLGHDPDADVSEVIKRVEGSNVTPAMLRSDVANPKGTGESDDPGERNPAFVKQSPSQLDSATGPQAAIAAGQEPSEAAIGQTVETEPTFDDAFDDQQ